MFKDPLTKAAVEHTKHCLQGCAIGEISGMAISTGLKWSNFANIVLSVILAFFFGYLLTFRSIRRHKATVKEAAKTAVAIDTVSISTMELLDNAFILVVPGAINATLSSLLFWSSLVLSLVIAFFLTVPVNRWFIGRGIGPSTDDHEHMCH